MPTPHPRGSRRSGPTSGVASCMHVAHVTPPRRRLVDDLPRGLRPGASSRTPSMPCPACGPASCTTSPARRARRRPTPRSGPPTSLAASASRTLPAGRALTRATRSAIPQADGQEIRARRERGTAATARCTARVDGARVGVVAEPGVVRAERPVDDVDERRAELLEHRGARRAVERRRGRDRLLSYAAMRRTSARRRRSSPRSRTGRAHRRRPDRGWRRPRPAPARRSTRRRWAPRCRGGPGC